MISKHIQYQIFDIVNQRIILILDRTICWFIPRESDTAGDDGRMQFILFDNNITRCTSACFRESSAVSNSRGGGSGFPGPTIPPPLSFRPDVFEYII